VADGSPAQPSRRTAADDGPGLLALAIGLGAAGTAFAATFRGPREQFWTRMTWTGASLGSLALLLSRRSRGARVRWWHVPLGLLSAATLYVTFQIGDRFARRFVPGGDVQIRDIYGLRALRPRGEIATRLATVVGPAEELFWRGLVQAALMRRFGRWRGAALAAGAYGGIHVTSGNFTLLGAAGVAGAHWCALYAAGAPLGVLIVSHVAWDIWIFLIQPTGEIEAPAAP
jgi:membrane protease YdiL (CAAX protease family)